jgi:nucleotide-binding universal stress UspA family protein
MTLQESEIRTGDVVVGHDGSRHSTVAVEWAAAEAARRACRLQILLAIPTDELGLPIPVNLSSPLVPGQDSDVADLLLDHARRLATKLVPEDAVRTGVVRRKPAPALLAASAHAALVVTGSRGHGAVGSALLGSVSTTVAEHAACPVVIVRGTVEDVDHPRAVTVGVDGTAASAAAAEFAADAAARRRATLRIVSAWMPTTRWHRGQVDVPPAVVAQWADELSAVAGTIVDNAAEVAHRAHPDLVVQTETPELPASLSLEDASRTSDLVVVGSRGLSISERAILGSAGRSLLRTSACPVAVVRH